MSQDEKPFASKNKLVFSFKKSSFISFYSKCKNGSLSAFMLGDNLKGKMLPGRNVFFKEFPTCVT
jgi:hypothetical protein